MSQLILPNSNLNPTFTNLNRHPKVLDLHLKKQAVIYIRQSSPYQVENHLESQKRQYQLTERVQKLGWPLARCTVIDEDLGISGAQSFNRAGYQRLVSMVALKEVGIVVGLEVSRLARNSLDWYQLLELAAFFEVLIADEDGVYDPAEFNDRLLLGLKGTISEAELYQIKARMVRGRLNKAKRGDLSWNMPIGLDYDVLGERITLAVDQSVRHTVAQVFDLFKKVGSVRGVLTYLQREGVELPSQRLYRGVGRVVSWHPARYHVIYSMLTNPMYAGIYVYGKTQLQIDPIGQTRKVTHKERGEWQAFLPDHHPGYLNEQEFEANLAKLEDNYNQFAANHGAVREGATLLQGLVWCKQCGKRMRCLYSGGRARYVCDADNRKYGRPVCSAASAGRVDVLVEELFLTLINSQTLEQSVAYDQKLKEEAATLDRHWQEKLQRLSYQADLARRRYETVDPANRLVALTLETDWNERLVELENARKTYQLQRPTAAHLESSLAQIQEVVANLRQYWYQENLSQQDKKELLRCVIERVNLYAYQKGKVIRAEVCWQGGATSELEVPKYLFSTPQLYHRVTELAKSLPDGKIAQVLNSESLHTVKGREWSPRRVMDFRLSNGIPSGFTINPGLRISNNGYIPSAEAAARLEVKQGCIQKWFKMGLLKGQHAGGQSPLWIEWTEDIGERLLGKAGFDGRMVSILRLCKERGTNWEQTIKWCLEQGHRIYRLRRGTKLKFYCLPKSSSSELQ